MRKLALSAVLLLALMPGRAASEDLRVAGGGSAEPLRQAYWMEPDEPVWRPPAYPYRYGGYDAWRSRPPVWYGPPRYPAAPSYSYRGYQSGPPYRGYDSYRFYPRYDRYGQQRTLPQWQGNWMRPPNYRWADVDRAPWQGRSDAPTYRQSYRQAWQW
jgi:hypothetical protein